MKRFKNQQRVMVNEKFDPLKGKLGTVVRLRRADNGAWIKMDDALPLGLASFPSDDSRCNDIVLYPDECDEVK